MNFLDLHVMAALHTSRYYMSNATEIVLFHVDDPNPARFSGDGNTLYNVIFNLCIRSIRHFSPGSTITLVTDENTRINDPYPDLTVIRSYVDTDRIMYERSRLYKEHVERRSAEQGAPSMAFLDTDIFVMRDLAPVFSPEFDVALTTRLTQDTVLNEHGMYDQTKSVSPINGGVLFAKPTNGAVAFFREHMRVYDELHGRGELAFHQGGEPTDIRKWGGDQFAYMAMVGKDLQANRPSPFVHKDALVRFYDCDTYNYSPDMNSAVTYEQLTSKYVVHMKGRRKVFMPAVAKMLNIV